MQKFILELFLTLQGIGAASGISYTNDALYIIADNRNALFRYDLLDKKLTSTPLLGQSQDEPIVKAEKSDFESITQRGDELLIFGSGSTEKRNSLIRYHLLTKAVKQEDLSATYRSLQEKYNIDQDNFNIEGIVPIGDELWLFNRGNGDAKKNGILVIHAETFEPKGYFPIPLPAIDGVETSFTDAVLCGDVIYFIAAAEDASSTYLDGEIKGSILGQIAIANKTLIATQIISHEHKFEGISTLKKTATALQFILCEDKDDDGQETKLYTLTLAN